MNLSAILFTTTTCSKCPEMKVYVKKLTFPIQVVNDKMPMFLEMAGNFGVQSVPTLILFEEENDSAEAKEIFRCNEPSECDDFLKQYERI